jgi:nucleoid DNA-binding protein
MLNKEILEMAKTTAQKKRKATTTTKKRKATTTTVRVTRSKPKVTTKKVIAKKVTTKKVTTKKVTANSLKIGKKPLTKSQLCTTLSDLTGLTKKEVTAVLFEALPTIIKASLKSGARQFTLPGLLKTVIKVKPATKARKGLNPFTQEMTTFKAKPRRETVKVQPLKGLKDMVAKK